MAVIQRNPRLVTVCSVDDGRDISAENVRYGKKPRSRFPYQQQLLPVEMGCGPGMTYRRWLHE
jgi:hypothetical protein